MKYVSVENIIFVCVIAGMLTAFAGLWCNDLVVFCIGLMVGGFMPMVVAEIWSSRL
jgi:hypothetical protein